MTERIRTISCVVAALFLPGSLASARAQEMSIPDPGAYVDLASADLATWNELGAVTNSGGAILFTDVTPHLSSRKFYKAQSK